MSVSVRVLASVREVAAAAWDALVADDSPFLEWQWLAALEEGQSVGERTGWLPQHLTLWEGDPPAGTRHTWNLVLRDLPAASSLVGARRRLANLGYPVGAGDGLDPTTRRSLTEFQRAHDLDPTGALDGATTALLSQVHGT